MLQDLLHQLLGTINNQFLSGGLVLMLVGSLGYALRRIPGQLYAHFLYYGTVVVDITNDDIVYTWLLYWLESQPYGKRNRRVSVKHVCMNNGERKLVLVPARGIHWFLYKGRILWLSRALDKDNEVSAGSMHDFLNTREKISIRLLGRSRRVIESLLQEAEVLFNTSNDNLLQIHNYRWSSWADYFKVKRPIDSVFLPEDARDLLADMRKFVSSEPWYRKMGIPHRRGYLFYGPPGTGKSVSAEMLAGALGVPLYVLNLAGLSDSALENAIAGMHNTSSAVLLIEDVDTVMVKRDATYDKQRISLGTLLNVLDGIQAAENIILIMTSNNPEGLDPSLTRKGRVDRSIMFGMASEEQINTAVSRFIKSPTIQQCRQIATWPRPICMADVQENLKQMVLHDTKA